MFLKKTGIGFDVLISLIENGRVSGQKVFLPKRRIPEWVAKKSDIQNLGLGLLL